MYWIIYVVYIKGHIYSYNRLLKFNIAAQFLLKIAKGCKRHSFCGTTLTPNHHGMSRGKVHFTSSSDSMIWHMTTFLNMHLTDQKSLIPGGICHVYTTNIVKGVLTAHTHNTTVKVTRSLVGLWLVDPTSFSNKQAYTYTERFRAMQNSTVNCEIEANDGSMIKGGVAWCTTVPIMLSKHIWFHLTKDIADADSMVSRLLVNTMRKEPLTCVLLPSTGYSN